MNSTTGRKVDPAPLIVGVALLIIAGVVYWDATNITRSVNYGMGPQVIPEVVAGFVALLGLAHLVVALRSGFNLEPEAIDPKAIGWILFGLIFLIASVPLNIGFIIAMTVLFASTARAFGRTEIVVDLAIGFITGTVIYVIFTKLLTLGLPQGPLEKLIG
ncbi:tripartite tricarboxylate transporter TctB family protein [Terrarubrum flagellatum]|uniref:tripartite tricarboxylate transporter TctB family protein n=1 Tax=Terrirubrum flagellatum TaxID=2895980 RepID=UPI0031450DE4